MLKKRHSVMVEKRTFRCKRITPRFKKRGWGGGGGSKYHVVITGERYRLFRTTYRQFSPRLNTDYFISFSQIRIFLVYKCYLSKANKEVFFSEIYNFKLKYSIFFKCKICDYRRFPRELFIFN